ncbi:hypothetical protein [Caballeronia novacaledonica]|uniref:hypothetical protein n=1 Tax=Caballeronia novacaledonica TaxID=1544861 RepID=UPI0011B204F7|nr:hypothetical protein [Caballeronia novacaledonica]
MAFSFLLGESAFLGRRIMADSSQPVAACRTDVRPRRAFFEIVETRGAVLARASECLSSAFFTPDRFV